MRSRLPLIAALVVASAALLVYASLVAASAVIATRIEARHPPIGEFLTVGGQRLHYVHVEAKGSDCAPRPPLVLLHGAATSLADLLPRLVPALIAACFEIVAFDRPGHGYSDAADDALLPDGQARRVAEALSELGLADAVWIGHSHGAALVMAGLLDGLATAGVSIAGAVIDDGDDLPAQVVALATPGLGPWIAWSAIAPFGRDAIAPAVQRAFAPETVPDEYLEATALTLSLRPAAALADARQRAALPDWFDTAVPRYSTIEAPVLAIVGDADTIAPPDEHLAALAALPALRVEVLGGAGHGIVHTRTEAVVAAIKAFVEEVQPGPWRAPH